MKLRGIAENLTKEQEDNLRKKVHRSVIETGHCVEVGREYLAYGLMIWNGEPFVEIYWDRGYVIMELLCLFEIIDNRASKYWKYKSDDDAVFLWPELFYTEYFHDDFSKGIPEVVEKFTTLKKLMDEEFAE
jgi:hypothetical protein